jgi:hypothetical protein
MAQGRQLRFNADAGRLEILGTADPDGNLDFINFVQSVDADQSTDGVKRRVVAVIDEIPVVGKLL